MSPGLPDDAGSDDRTAHERHPAQHMRRAEDPRQSLAGIDAVLQRDHDGVAANHRVDMISRRFNVPELDAEQHQIDGAERGSSSATTAPNWCIRLNSPINAALVLPDCKHWFCNVACCKQ